MAVAYYCCRKTLLLIVVGVVLKCTSSFAPPSILHLHHEASSHSGSVRRQRCHYNNIRITGGPTPLLQHHCSNSRSSVLLSSSDSAVDSSMFWPTSSVNNSIQLEEPAEGDGEDEDDHRLARVLDSILKVHCTHSEPDFLIPWQKQHQSTSTSSGFVISVAKKDDNDDGSSSHNLRVMTNAHSVEYGSIVQVQRRGDERKYEAEVETMANECDLAILRVRDAPNSFWDDLEPLEFGPLPSLQDEVEVFGFPTGGDSLSITQGVVSRIEMQEYTQASFHLLAIQIDAAINPGNSGGPVVNEDLQVVGVAFQGLDGAENIGYVVPVTVVQHVLHDIERNGNYTGFCSLGVGFSLLENKAFRKSLGMADDGDDKDLSGVMVKEVAPTAACKGILRPNDVVCQIDGIPVANDGKIPFRPGERVAVTCYTQTKFVGDTVRLQVLREGKEIELDAPVGISKRLVPTHWHNRPPPYLIMAGLVFTALSVPFLHASDAWDSYVSDPISYLLGKWHDPLPRETDEVVILAQVLAHRENLGYDKLTDLHLKKVNGQEVRSLHHLQHLIDESCPETFLRFEFAPDNQIVVMERSSLERVTQEVCKEHSIQNPVFLHPCNDADGESKEDETTNGAVPTQDVVE